MVAPVHSGRDVRFGIEIRSDWSQMGQIWDFKVTDLSHLGQSDQIYLPNLTYLLEWTAATIAVSRSQLLYNYNLYTSNL